MVDIDDFETHSTIMHRSPSPSLLRRPFPQKLETEMARNEARESIYVVCHRHSVLPGDPAWKRDYVSR